MYVVEVRLTSLFFECTSVLRSFGSWTLLRLVKLAKEAVRNKKHYHRSHCRSFTLSPYSNLSEVARPRYATLPVQNQRPTLRQPQRFEHPPLPRHSPPR